MTNVTTLKPTKTMRPSVPPPWPWRTVWAVVWSPKESRPKGSANFCASTIAMCCKAICLAGQSPRLPGPHVGRCSALGVGRENFRFQSRNKRTSPVACQGGRGRVILETSSSIKTVQRSARGNCSATVFTWLRAACHRRCDALPDRRLDLFCSDPAQALATAVVVVALRTDYHRAGRCRV